MTELRITCGTCNGDGFASTGDRHAETRKDVCPECGGQGLVRAATGETPRASSGAGLDGSLYAAQVVTTPLTHAGEVDALRKAFEVAQIQEVFVNGDTADVYTMPPGSSFISEQELIARCSCGELWLKRATAIALALNYVPTHVLASPASTVRATGVEAELAKSIRANSVMPLPDVIGRLRMIQDNANKSEDRAWLSNTAYMAIRHLETFAAVQARPDAGVGWQPIDTAPRDGTIILASWLDERGGQTVQGAAWLKDSYGKYYWGVHGEHKPGWSRPTHWQPLPAAPTPSPEPTPSVTREGER